MEGHSTIVLSLGRRAFESDERIIKARNECSDSETVPHNGHGGIEVVSGTAGDELDRGIYQENSGRESADYAYTTLPK